MSPSVTARLRDADYFRLEMMMVAGGTVVTIAWFAAVMSLNTLNARKIASPLTAAPIQFAGLSPEALAKTAAPTATRILL